MAYDTSKDKLSSISWNLKRIADALEDLIEIESNKQEPINKIRDKYTAQRISKMIEQNHND